MPCIELGVEYFREKLIAIYILIAFYFKKKNTRIKR
jgi:hypothetical protein